MKAVRRQLLQQFNLEIGAGLGSLAGKVWRIGLMGYASNPKNVMLCVNALEAVLSQYNAPIHKGWRPVRFKRSTLSELNRQRRGGFDLFHRKR